MPRRSVGKCQPQLHLSAVIAYELPLFADRRAARFDLASPIETYLGERIIAVRPGDKRGMRGQAAEHRTGSLAGSALLNRCGQPHRTGGFARLAVGGLGSQDSAESDR